MTASLHHAQPVLTAAINAGFRESGVQSLKALDDVNSFPMVAVRSAGLALESVVGACHEVDQDDGEDEDEKELDEVDEYEDDETVYSLVSEEYCEMLLKLANERFKSNAKRMERFGDDLFSRKAGHASDWEDSEARKERKRAEGLKKQEVLRRETAVQRSNAAGNNDQAEGTLL